MCKGKLKKEEQITKGNTIVKSMRIGDKTTKTSSTTIEAIGEVLLRAAAMGFKGHIIIYTDNKGAVTQRRSTAAYDALAKSFYSVNVYRIDRDHNKCADELIRKNDIMLLPKNKMNEVINTYCACKIMVNNLQKKIYIQY